MARPAAWNASFQHCRGRRPGKMTRQSVSTGMSRAFPKPHYSMKGLGIRTARELPIGISSVFIFLRAIKAEFIVDATVIPRMMVTSAFSNRMEFSVRTAGDTCEQYHPVRQTSLSRFHSFRCRAHRPIAAKRNS